MVCGWRALPPHLTSFYTRTCFFKGDKPCGRKALGWTLWTTPLTTTRLWDFTCYAISQPYTPVARAHTQVHVRMQQTTVNYFHRLTDEVTVNDFVKMFLVLHHRDSRVGLDKLVWMSSAFSWTTGNMKPWYILFSTCIPSPGTKGILFAQTDRVVPHCHLRLLVNILS